MSAFGETVLDRLKHLGVSQREFTAAGFLSRSTLARVVSGEQDAVRADRAPSLERGLLWLPGEIDEAIAGGAPVGIRLRGWPRADRDWGKAVEQSWAAYELAAPPSTTDALAGLNAEDVALIRSLPDWLQAQVVNRLGVFAMLGGPAQSNPTDEAAEVLTDIFGVKYMAVLAPVIEHWCRASRRNRPS